MVGFWLVGVGINLFGSIMINLGTNLMKLGHNKRAIIEKITGNNLSIRGFQEWKLGIFLFLFGNLANFISFGYAAQSLLSALGSVQFVSNVIFASIVLKEKVTKSIVFATGCIVIGCVMLFAFGSHESKEFTVEQLMDLYSKAVYISYLIFLASCVMAMYIIYKFGKKKLLDDMPGLNMFWYRLVPVSYALFSGLIGTQSVLFGKTISTLLRVTISGNNQLDSWFTWLIIIAFLITSTFWMIRLNKGLKLFPAMIIVPTMQISWTIFSVLSGMLYFQEYKDITFLQGILFTLAIFIVFGGVLILTRNEENNKLPIKNFGKERDIDDNEMVSNGYTISTMDKIPSDSSDQVNDNDDSNSSKDNFHISVSVMDH